jgi:hypothetical protein
MAWFALAQVRVPDASVTVKDPLSAVEMVDASFTVAFASPLISSSTLGAICSRMPSSLSDLVPVQDLEIDRVRLDEPKEGVQSAGARLRGGK